MGETRALKPFFDTFSKDEINLTVVTNTGFEEAQKIGVSTRYLPFEIFLPFWIQPQKAVVVMEAELWYMLFLIAKKKGAKTYLINARINDKSFATYKKYDFFYKKIFENIDMIFAQTHTDKQRLQELGGKNIEVIGNIKLATLPKVTKNLQKPNGYVVTAASTHKSEEELVLQSWRKEYGKLLIVPRHPERFDEVYNLIKTQYQASDVSYSRYSITQNFDTDIVLVDMMGELINIYSISDAVILGGGFIKTAGGHNPVEPAYFNTVLLSGKSIFNQKSLFECVNDYYLIEKEDLGEYLKNITNLKKSYLAKAGSIEPILQELKKL